MYKIMYFSKMRGTMEKSVYPNQETAQEALDACSALNRDGIDNEGMIYFPLEIEKEKPERLIDCDAETVGIAVRRMKEEGLSLEEIVEVLKGKVE